MQALFITVLLVLTISAGNTTTKTEMQKIKKNKPTKHHRNKYIFFTKSFILRKRNTQNRMLQCRK